MNINLEYSGLWLRKVKEVIEINLSVRCFVQLVRVGSLQLHLLVHFYQSFNVLLLSEARQFLDKLCAEKGVECSSPRTTARLLDKVSAAPPPTPPSLVLLCMHYVKRNCIPVVPNSLSNLRVWFALKDKYMPIV